jgi:hypothetical protein
VLLGVVVTRTLTTAKALLFRDAALCYLNPKTSPLTAKRISERKKNRSEEESLVSFLQISPQKMPGGIYAKVEGLLC